MTGLDGHGRRASQWEFVLKSVQKKKWLKLFQANKVNFAAVAAAAVMMHVLITII